MEKIFKRFGLLKVLSLVILAMLIYTVNVSANSYVYDYNDVVSIEWADQKAAAYNYNNSNPVGTFVPIKVKYVEESTNKGLYCPYPHNGRRIKYPTKWNRFVMHYDNQYTPKGYKYVGWRWYSYYSTKPKYHGTGNEFYIDFHGTAIVSETNIIVEYLFEKIENQYTGHLYADVDYYNYDTKKHLFGYDVNLPMYNYGMKEPVTIEYDRNNYKLNGYRFYKSEYYLKGNRQQWPFNRKYVDVFIDENIQQYKAKPTIKFYVKDEDDDVYDDDYNNDYDLNKKLKIYIKYYDVDKKKTIATDYVYTHITKKNGKNYSPYIKFKQSKVRGYDYLYLKYYYDDEYISKKYDDEVRLHFMGDVTKYDPDPTIIFYVEKDSHYYDDDDDDYDNSIDCVKAVYKNNEYSYIKKSPNYIFDLKWSHDRCSNEKYDVYYTLYYDNKPNKTVKLANDTTKKYYDDLYICWGHKAEYIKFEVRLYRNGSKIDTEYSTKYKIKEDTNYSGHEICD